MNILDFLIGLTLMNAMPHLVLGTWKGRMFSAFGFGNWKNLAYAAVNAAVSLSLFLARYGTHGLVTNGIYAGALVLLLIYVFTGWFWYRLFHDAPPQR
jgi:hypothetical protein